MDMKNKELDWESPKLVEGRMKKPSRIDLRELLDFRRNTSTTYYNGGTKFSWNVKGIKKESGLA
jgi:hypothetical protein